MSGKPTTVQAYIDNKPELARVRLEEVRAQLKSVATQATEELKWGKPALVNNGIFMMYAAAANHISLHPTPAVIQALSSSLRGYTVLMNTIQFPINEELPKELLMRVAQLRLEHQQMGLGWK